MCCSSPVCVCGRSFLGVSYSHHVWELAVAYGVLGLGQSLFMVC